jgi:hypothetical protein
MTLQLGENIHFILNISDLGARERFGIDYLYRSLGGLRGELVATHVNVGE